MLRRSADYLAQRGCDTPRLDAEVLLASVLAVERLALYTDHERPLTTDETDRYRDAIARRGRREPVAYIVGRRGFRNLELAVSPAVLVPRPETELLVELACAVAPENGTVCDWGTGSGAIALAVSAERDDLNVTGLDISADALAVARGNDHASHVTWLVSDGFTAAANERFDVVVANPPYLSDADLAGAPPELGFEPAGALVSGPSGLEAFVRLADEVPAHLNPDGHLLLEVGEGQAPYVVELLAAAGFVEVEIHSDLAGIDRCVGGVRR